VLVVKSTNHYRADYEPLASHVLPVDSPGLSTMNPERHDYTAVSRPQYPVDEMDDDEYPTW
jgi:microcystin degradation protein MlrC